MLSAEMSTMAVLRKHAHQRVSFGVRSGTTLIPVQVSATNLGSTLSAPTGWHDESNGGFMGSWQFQVSATTPALTGIDVSVGIVRDLTYTDIITYEDGSSSQCKSASSSNSIGGFLPDSPYPNLAGSTNSTTSQSTDAHGNLVFSGSDSPDITLTQTERPYVISVQDINTAMNFIVVQVGTGSPQVLAQVNWSYSNTANFTRSPMGEAFSTEWKGNEQLIPNPTLGKTVYGATPTAQPITANRVSTAALNYFDTPSNWKPIGQPGQMAFKYSRNP
jgi:hypothetical protein